MGLDPQEQACLEVAQEAYRAFKVGALDEVEAHLSADVDWLAHGPSTVPLYGHWHGKDEAMAYLRQLAEQLDIESFEDRDYICQDDRVAVLVYLRGTVRSTGRPFVSEGVHIVTIREHQITHWRSHSDTAMGVAAFNPPEVQTAFDPAADGAADDPVLAELDAPLPS